MPDQVQLDRLRIVVVAEDSVQYESSCLGQHGISFFLTAERRGITRHVLVDVAQNPEALLQNMKQMEIPFPSLGAIVLTHCHYDHTQGVARVIKTIGKQNLPVIAHPDLFRLHFVSDPYLRHVGVMEGDRKPDIEAAGGMLCLTRDPLEIMPGLLTTGEVKRQTDFEQVGMSLFTMENGRLHSDLMLDDISVVANVKGKGVIIITGCSHAGIVNITRQATELTGTEKVHGILGGFHLVDASDTRIRKTVQGLKRFSPDWISAGHCTGFRAQVLLYQTFKDRFFPLQTGVKFDVS
jgi:7,8-dihydropterin-6-yl-methyl-4-(beta-D-ribofuranosyl)aminobenzene 5'-phosphate synthase